MQPYFPNRQQLAISSAWPGIVMGSQVSTIGTPLALDSAYTFGSAGDAIAGFFVLDEDRTLTDFWLVASAVTGTGEVDWEIRSGLGSGVNNSPGTTLVASGTINFSAFAADTWTKVTLGTPQALSKNVWYSLIIGDANGSGSDFVTIRTNTRWAGYSSFAPAQIQTTDGWATAGAVNAYGATMALKFSDGLVIGGTPLRATTSLSNNQVLRGIKLTLPSNGPSIVWSGLNMFSPSIGGWSAYVLRGATAQPGDISGSPYWSHTIPAGIDYSNTQTPPAYFFSETLPKLLPGETWYLLLKPDTNSNLPNKTTAWSGMDADLRKLLSGYVGIDALFVVEADSTSWTEDTDATIHAQFLCSIASQPTIAA